MQLFLSIIFATLAGLFIVSLASARKRAVRIANTALELEKAITTLVGTISETQKRINQPREVSLSNEKQNVIQIAASTGRYKGIELISGPHLIQRIRDIRKIESNYHVYMMYTKEGPILLRHLVSEATDYITQYERIGSELQGTTKLFEKEHEQIESSKLSGRNLVSA